MKLLLLSLLLLPLLLCGQTDLPAIDLSKAEKGISPVVGAAGTGQRPVTYAVVIGISDYQDPAIPDLRFADKDAEAFANYLRSPAGGSLDKDHLKLLINEQATSGRIAAALDGLVEQVKSGERVILYFSGHGDVERKTVSQPGFLLCWDSPSKVYMGGGTYSLAYLQEIITTLSTQNLARVIMITDACHAGKLSGSQIGGAQLTASNMAKQFANEVKILSCLPNEFSLEGEQWGGGRGCFSYHLVDGLYGLADKNADAFVSVSEIDRYLEDQVTRETAPHPQSPMVLGVKSEHLAAVNPAILSQLQKFKQGQLPQFSPTEGRVFEESLLADFSPGSLEAPLDSGVWEIYHKFRLAIKEKRFLEPADDCAEVYYQQLAGFDALRPLWGFMKRNYAAALQDEAQQAVNAILKTSVRDVTEFAIKRIKKYEYFPRLLARSAELLGPEHYMYATLKARQLAFEGLLLYFETYFSKDSQSVSAVIDKYRQSLKYQWEAPFTHYYMSLCFAVKGNQPDSALLHARIATGLAETWVLPYAHIAYYFSREYQRFDEAKSLLDEAMLIDSNSIVVWMGLGGLFHYQEKFSEAAKAYSKVIQLDSTNLLARTNLAIGLIEMQEYDKAEKTLRQVLAIKPDLFFAHYALACMYDRLNRQSEAEEMYLKALKINPLHVLCRDSLAKMYQVQDRLKEAELMNLEIIKIDQSNSEAWYRLASIAARGNRGAEAIDFLEKALNNGLKDLLRLKNDASFDSIRSVEEFRVLMKKTFPLEYRE